MAFTTTDQDSINSKISSGVEELRYSDRSQRNASLADQIRAKAIIDAEVSQGSAKPIVRQYRPVVGNGW